MADKHCTSKCISARRQLAKLAYSRQFTGVKDWQCGVIKALTAAIAGHCLCQNDRCAVSSINARLIAAFNADECSLSLSM